MCLGRRWMFLGLMAVCCMGLGAGIAAQQQGRVLAGEALVALHNRPDETALVIAYLGPDLLVIVLRTEGNWHEVRTQSGLQGWVPMATVRLNSVEALGRSGAAIVNPLPDPVVARLHEVFAVGQALGNHPDVFSKVGDSITVSRSFLHPIGAGQVDLAAFSALQRTVDYFDANPVRGGDSFRNMSLAAGVGWTAADLLDPTNADSRYCRVGESPLACEYRATKPSYALIMVGTNDVGYVPLEIYRVNLLDIMTITKAAGVIPIFSTIPAQPRNAERVNTFNATIREFTAANMLPLWEYAQPSLSLPNQGLTSDQIHPSTPPGGYGAVAVFTEGNLRYGYTLRNLTALQVLDQVSQYLR